MVSTKIVLDIFYRSPLYVECILFGSLNTFHNDKHIRSRVLCNSPSNYNQHRYKRKVIKYSYVPPWVGAMSTDEWVGHHWRRNGEPCVVCPVTKTACMLT